MSSSDSVNGDNPLVLSTKPSGGSVGREIVDEVLGEFLQIAAWRRELHRHPELSFREKATARFIAGVLRGDGIEFVPVAGTGILASVRGELPGRENDAVVLRADIDALPISEATGLEYASENDGVMHACGHDMHTAILLGALRILNRHRSEFSGTVLGLFQPGEESNPGGASMVLAEDPFGDYNIVAFAGGHVEPSMRTGTFGFRAGQYMAASDELRFTVRGTGGHAAMREKIKDPVQAAARLIEALYAIPPRRDPQNPPTIISIGKIVANGATNVVPDEVYMEGTMRTFDEEWRNRLKEKIRNEARKAGGLFGVVIDVDISEGYPSVCNDEALTEKVAAATGALFGLGACESLALRPTSDDFGFYCRRYPSVYYRLGAGGTDDLFDSGRTGRIHTPTFCPDEKAMGYGVLQFVNIALSMLA